MSFKLDLHPIQLAIIRDLTLKSNLRFRDLNTSDLSTDQFSFHLNQLVKQDLISKSSQLTYQLTNQGKIVAEFIDTRIAQFEEQAKVSVSVVARRTCKNTQEILIQKRGKHPYFGYWGTITGKVRKGELPVEAAKREFMEETGLTINKIDFKGIKHKLDYNPAGEILADKYFFVFLVTEFTGDLKSDFEEGHNQWIKVSDVYTLENLFEDMPLVLKMIDQTEISFEEHKFTVTGF